jgi:magnesium transporter
MVRNYYKSLRTAHIQEVPEPKRGTWIYVEAPTEDEIQDLASKFALDIDLLTDALDENETPRLDKEDGHSYIFARFAYAMDDGEIDTAPLLFVFAEDIVITISLKRFPALDKFISGRIVYATTQRTKFILQIMQEMVNQYGVYIARTSKKIKQIRSRLRGHAIRNQDLVEFVLIEDELNEFLSSLQPTNAMLRRLLLGRHIPLFEEDQDLVEDLLLNNEQSIEACNANIKSIANIREAYSAISSNNLNRTMKILTVATVAIALPNLFYGMYGMNVPLPLQHEPWAYWVMLAFTIIVPSTGLWIAHRRNVI